MKYIDYELLISYNDALIFSYTDRSNVYLTRRNVMEFHLFLVQMYDKCKILMIFNYEKSVYIQQSNSKG